MWPFKKRQIFVAPNPKTDPDLLRWAAISAEAHQVGYGGLTGWMQDFGHRALERLSKSQEGIAIDIGCGIGHHFQFLEDKERQIVCGLDITLNHLKSAQQKLGDVTLLQGDACYLPFRDNSVSKVYAIYIFEHLRRLNDCLDEIARVLRRDGELLAAIPTEGIAYKIGRKLTIKRAIEKKYKIDYDKVMAYEHCNTYRDVMDAIQTRFQLTDIQYLPFRIPTAHLNAIIVVRCVRKN